MVVPEVLMSICAQVIRLSGHKLSFSRSGMYDYVSIGKYMGIHI